MTPEAERAYVKQWAQTGRLLELRRWEELREMTGADARRASGFLIEAALRVSLPTRRRVWSGLVEQQDRLHGRSDGARP